MENRNGLHDNWFVVIRKNASVCRLCIMTSSRLFYVVGPPTPCSEDIAALLDVVLSATGVIPTAHIEVTNVEGPIPFHSAWTPGGRQRILRPGLAVLQLWTGVVSWQATADVRSLSVIVMDDKYIKQT